MAVEPALAQDQLPDGVYLDLPEDIYFAQNRLGSSDLIKLHKHKEGWWWQSRWNPDRGGQTDSQNYGSALHSLMLEGIGAYERRFAVEPDPKDYPGLLKTTAEIKTALTEEGLDLKGTSAWTKDQWNGAAAVHIPNVPVWDNIKADFDSVRGDRRSIPAIEDRMLRLMYEAALEDPDVRRILGVGEDVPVLAEVSVFWTDEFGTGRRARFDKPVPKFTLDLKSLGNWQGRALKHGVGDNILRDGYDIQVADQHVARRRAYEMVLEDAARLSGGTEEERAWFMAMAHRAPWRENGIRWEWVWLFYQKPELSGRAPIIFPVWENWRGPFHVSGHRKAIRAMETFRACVERFGLGDQPAADGSPPRPWRRVEPIHYVEEGYEPRISLPHFGWDEDPVEGEEEALG